MNRLLKVNWNDQLNDLIDGLQRISDTELDGSLIPYVLEDFAFNSGTGHINLGSGDQIGTFENTYWDQSLGVGDSIEHHTTKYTFDDGTAQGWTFDAPNFGLKTNRIYSGTHSIGIEDASAPTLLASHSPADLSGGKQIDRLSYWYQKNASSEGGGGMVLDSAGNEVIGVSSSNSVLAFDGVDDYVDTRNSFYSITEGDFTVELYAYTGGTNLSTAFSQGIAADWSANLFLFYVGNDGGEGVRIYWDGASVFTLNDDTWFNTWTHFALTKSGSTFTLYKDGVQVASASRAGSWISDSQSIGAGNNAGSMSQFYQGELSEVRVWNVVRTQTQIQDNMNTRLTGSETGLVGYYPLAGDANDYTANNNNGTLAGPTWISKLSIDDANGFGWIETGDANDSWYQLMLDFDWTAGTATVSYHNTNGLVEAWMDRPLKNNTDAAQIELRTHGGLNWGAGSCYMWFDDIAFEYTELRTYNTVTTPLYQNRNAVGSLSFDGVDDAVSIYDITKNDQEDWTFEVWAYEISYENYSALIGNDGDYRYTIGFHGNGDSILFREKDGTLHTFSLSSNSTGRWVHVACVMTGSTRTIEVFEGGTSLGTSVCATTSEVIWNCFGHRRSVEYWNGKLDDVRIWNVARTQTEIQNNMNNRLTGSETGLVGYWPLAGDAKDYTANGNDGTLQNGPTWVDDNPEIVPRHYLAYEGGSLSFDGVDDYVDYGDVTTLEFPTTNFSAEFWCKPDSTTIQAGIVSKRGTGSLGTVQGWGVRQVNDGISLEMDDGTNGPVLSFVGSVLSLNTWAHIAVTVDRSANASLYVDGNFIDSVDVSVFGDISGTRSLTIGSTPGLVYLFDGEVSDVRIWDHIRTQTQIQDNMNKRLNGDETGLVGYWRLAGSAYDYSVNDNHGTLVNGPTWVNGSPFTPGGDLRVLSRKNLRDSIVSRAVDEMVNNEGVGCFRIFEGTTLPGTVTGEWEKVGEYVDEDTATSTTTFTLWKKINTSLGSLAEKPLCHNKELNALQRMSENEVRLLSELVREYIYKTGIGEYVLAENAPTTGTWMAVGDPIPDERYDVSTQTHYHTYHGARTYSGNYGSNYNSNYGANYTANYGSNFWNNFTGYYNANYAQNYGSNYTRNFGQNYGSYYTANYGANYGSNFWNNFTGYFAGYFTGYFNQNYGAIYGKAGYSSNYNQNYIQNYGSNFWNNYGSNFWNNFTGYFTGYFNANYGSNYVGYYGNNYTGYYGSNYNSNYVANYDNNYTGYYNNNYASNFVETYTGNRKYSGNYAGTTSEQTIQNSLTTHKTLRLWVRTG